MRRATSTILFTGPILLAGLVLLAGCAVSVDGRASPAAPDRVAMRGIHDLLGTWRGTYRCAQGETGLVLDITPESAPGSDLLRLRAVFTFGPTEQNPGVPHGSYTMRVTGEPGNVFRFTQREWVSRPGGYRMVDLVGTLVGSRLSGSVAGAACTTFAVTRD